MKQMAVNYVLVDLRKHICEDHDYNEKSDAEEDEDFRARSLLRGEGGGRCSEGKCVGS